MNVPEWLRCGDAVFAGGSLKKPEYTVSIKAFSEEEGRSQLTELGGKKGYDYGNILWKRRAFIDRLLDGAGLNRGSRHPSEIKPGDAVDFLE